MYRKSYLEIRAYREVHFVFDSYTVVSNSLPCVSSPFVTYFSDSFFSHGRRTSIPAYKAGVHLLNGTLSENPR